MLDLRCVDEQQAKLCSVIQYESNMNHILRVGAVCTYLVLRQGCDVGFDLEALYSLERRG